MSRIRELYKNKFNSFGAKILIILILCNLIIGLVSFLYYKVYSKILIDEIGTNRVDVIRQVSDRIDSIKSNIYTLSNLYYYDQDLRDILEEVSLNNEDEFKMYLDLVTEKYKLSLNQYDINYMAVLLTDEGIGYSSSEVNDDYDFMNPKYKIWFKKVCMAEGEVVDIANYKDRINEKEYISVARVIMINDLIEAYLMINVDERDIFKMYSSIISPESSIYVVDEKGTIISSNIESLCGFNYFSMKNLDKLFGEKNYVICNKNKEKILCTRYYSEKSRITILEEIPLVTLLNPINKIKNIIMIIVILAIVIESIMVGYFLYKTYIPIKELSRFMKKVRIDNLENDCNVSGYIEINVLKQGLNQLLDTIRELLKKVKKEEEEKHNIELSFLQAQINPHFMYNTLFSIKCMVDMNENNKASNMISLFIKILRNSLSNPINLISIEEEFNGLTQYVELLKFRYENKFDVFFECDDCCLKKKLPKLLIQPLIENAIFHGVEPKDGEGTIFVVAKIEDKKLIITVEDDGIGISEERIFQIVNKEVKDKISSSHIGIENVDERIRLNFGEEYGLKIESMKENGTKIILILPIIE